MLIEASNLAFQFRHGNPIFQGWSESFQSGDAVSLTGPSGRGKSTLLYVLGLMLRPSQGSVSIDGIDIGSRKDPVRAVCRAHNIGFVFQDAALDPSRSILDNVLETVIYRGESRRAHIAHAQHLMTRFGVQARPRARPGQISGGQAQRIALCRALLGSPRLILADEPTGNLDGDTSEIVISALLESAANGAIVIVATHDPSVVGRLGRNITL